jgi:aminopeptidase N
MPTLPKTFSLKLKTMQKIIFILLIGFSLSSAAQFNCQQTKQWRQLQASAGSVNNNAKSDTFNITHYNLKLDLTAIDQQNFKAVAQVHFTPKLAGVTRLNLDLLQLQIDSIRFKRNSGAFQRQGFSYQYNDSLLALSLNQSLPLGDSAVFQIYYSGYPQKDASGWGGFHAGSGYFYNLGVGFAANPHTFGRAWFPCYDNFVEKSTYHLEVLSRTPRLPLLSGDSITRTTLAGDTVLSAATLNTPIPTYLVSFALSNYAFLSDTVMGQNGPIDILLAAKPQDTANLRASFVNLKATFTAFEDYFGPYHWPRIGYALTTVGAMEHATSIHYPISLVDGTLQGEDIMAHELAHHWFGNLLTCQTAEDMWINEGMAEFCSHLYQEAVYNRARYQRTIRDNAYNVLNFASTRDGGHAALYGPSHENVYGYHTYQKGAMVAHNLRHYLGDADFFGAFRQIFQANKYGNITTLALRDSLLARTGNPAVTDFFRDWILNPGYAQFSVEDFSYAPLLGRVSFDLKQRLYAAPALHSNVPVDVTFFSATGDTLTLVVNHSGKTSSHSGLLLPFEPVAALANFSAGLLTASSYDYYAIQQAGSLSSTYGEMNLNVDQFKDSGQVVVMHHRVAPEKKPTNPFDFNLSQGRYWTIAKIGLDQTKLSASLTFNGSNNGQDQALLQNGNDSLVVLYRPKGKAQWNIYPHQTKQAGSPRSRVGTFELKPLLSGDYTLANTAESLSNSELPKTTAPEIAIYPNPAEQHVTVAIPYQGQDTVLLKLLSTDGKLLLEKTVNMQQENQAVVLELSAFSAKSFLLQIGKYSEKIILQ